MTTSLPQSLRLARHLIGLVLIAVLTGCATTSTVDNEQMARDTAEKIYANGRSALLGQDYQSASQYFKKLEANYPDSPYNQQAQMELAYAYFKAGDFNASIATSERLIRNYPENDNLDYSLYLKALASFEQASQLIAHSQDSENSILAAQTALHNFNDLTTQFPQSKYQQDADKRIDYLQEQLAQYEVTAARNAIEQGNHASAVVHARNVVENYPQTRSAADALAIVDMGYEIMSLGQAPNNGVDTPTPQTTEEPDLESTAMFTNIAVATEAASSAMNTVVAQQTTTQDTMADTIAEASTTKATPTVADIPAIKSGVQAEIKPAITLTGAQSSNWLLQQPSDHYSVQLISTHSDDTLSEFIRHHQLEDQVAYYRKQVNGKTWHTLVYGVFSSIEDARTAITGLPDSIQSGKPWVVSMATIQNAINTIGNNN